MAGSALRYLLEAEDWVLAELKQRLDALGDDRDRAPRQPRQQNGQESPAAILAARLQESRGVDADAARQRLYRQTLLHLLPDQVAMLALLAERGVAPLCHVAAGRLPAGPVTTVVLSNATSLGRDAGVLLREYVPHYVADLLARGVFEVGPEEEQLADQYELLLADTQIRRAMDRIRQEFKLYPRLQRYSLRLSAYGSALWRDCRPPHDGGRRGNRTAPG